MTRRKYPIGASATLEMLATDPHPLFHRLRAEEPVSWIDVYGGWLVTRRDLCVAAMRDAPAFTVDDPRFSTGRVIGPSMLSLDGAEHVRHRTPFVDPFRAAPVRSRFGDWVRRRAQDLTSQLLPRGSADLRAELAAPLSVDVMSHALQLRDVPVAELLSWYEAIVEAVDEVTVGGEVPDRGRGAFTALSEAVSASIDHSSLLSEVAASQTLSEREIVSNVAVLLFGGIVTAESTTASTLRYLLTDPDLFFGVLQRRDLVPAVVEEALRLEPAAGVVDRYATTDVDFGGARIRRGELVRISLTAAGRDPAVFDEPDTLDPHRHNASQHLAFAVGPHACIGIHLARLETAAAVNAVLDSMPDLEPGSAGLDDVSGLIFRAPATVAAVWTPSAASPG